MWTATLTVDETAVDEKGTFTWESLVATNLANKVQNSIKITGGDNDEYVLGGFVQRVVNFGAFQADSTEAVIATDENKIASGSFSNGNPGVPQPFPTADTTDVGKEGWFAPSAEPVAAGTSVNIHMLHSPTAAAHGGLTLTDLEETV